MAFKEHPVLEKRGGGRVRSAGEPPSGEVPVLKPPCDEREGGMMLFALFAYKGDYAVIRADRICVVSGEREADVHTGGVCMKTSVIKQWQYGAHDNHQYW